jgi:aminomethyltransferase
MSLKTTPFYELHKRHNARMVPFGRWLMPLQYTHIRDEHLAVRKKAGLFDASHMGNILVTGKDAEKFSDRLLTNQIAGRKPFRAVYGMFCNERGGVIDDLIVYKYNRDKLMFVVNAGCADKDLHWMKHQSFSSTFYDVKIQDLSEETCILAVQGPESPKILEKPLRKKGEFRNLQRFSFYDDTFSSVPITVARTGYTGENGYELYFNRKHARQVWDILMKEGRPFGLTLCGLGARDSLRLEKCYPLYGNELSETVTPLEADLKWAVSFRKDFIGRKALEGVKSTERRLVAFTMLEDRVPRHGYPILSQEEKEIGTVSSGGISFSLGKNIGMGFVPAAYARWDLPVKILIRDKAVPAKIIKPPFVADRKN